VPSCGETRCGYSIRPSTTLWFERLDQTLFFEAGEGAVQRPRAETNAGESFDVLEQGVAVLRSGNETDEDEKEGVVLLSESVTAEARNARHVQTITP
jgi:hypothetical protein